MAATHSLILSVSDTVITVTVSDAVVSRMQQAEQFYNLGFDRTSIPEDSWHTVCKEDTVYKEETMSRTFVAAVQLQ